MPGTDLLQGTLDLLILRTLALEPMHGWGIAQRIQQVFKDALQIGQGSLYPLFTGWSTRDGSTLSGELPKTIARPSFIR
jgi:hypothetical protein